MSNNRGGNLRDRVAAQRNGTDGGGGEIAQRDSLEAQIKRMAPEFELAMPHGREATQLVRDAITCLRKIEKLDACDSNSLLGALMTCAQLGLRPAVLGHAWPLPYWDGKAGRYRAQLVIGYLGYVELAYRSGKVTAITSRIVRQSERFDITYHEDRDELIHKPSVDGLPGEIRAFYSTARLVNNGYTVTEPWSVARMEAHRDQHAPRNRSGGLVGPWKDNFPAMGQKTMVLQNCRLLPKSEELAIAIDADEGLRVNIDPRTNAAEVTEHPDAIPGQVEHSDEPPTQQPERESTTLSEPPSSQRRPRQQSAPAAEQPGSQQDGDQSQLPVEDPPGLNEPARDENGGVDPADPKIAWG